MSKENCIDHNYGKIRKWENILRFQAGTRRGREIVEVLKKKAVSIAYVQDTK